MYEFLLSLCVLLSFNIIFAQEKYTEGQSYSGASFVKEVNADIMQRDILFRDVTRQSINKPVPYVNSERCLLPQNPESSVLDDIYAELNRNLYTHDVTVHAPQSVGVNFLAATAHDVPYYPPDSMGVVGPQQFTLTINGLIKTFNKNTGAPDGVLNTSLENLFNSVRNGSGISDPRIRFDRHSQRWIIVAINVENTNNRIVIAVSDGPNITLSTVWNFSYILAGTGCFHDYPTLGVDRFALYIGGTSFCNNNDAKVFVVKKSSVLSAGSIQYTMFNNLIDVNGVGLFTPQGVDNFDTNSTVGYFIGVDNSLFGRLILRRVVNPGGTPSLSSNIFITVPSTYYPLLVNHKGNTGGSAGRLDAIDDRLMCAHVRNGHLWTTHNLGMNNTGLSKSANRTRNGARWYELDVTPTVPSIVQVGTFFNQTSTNATTDLFYWIPSIMTSGQGHMALGCSAAGSNHFIDAITVGRLSSTTANTLLTPTFITSTSAAYNPSFDRGGSTGRRWGDFSYTSLDPADDMTMWTAQEYASSPNIWGVRVAKLIAPPPATINRISSSVARGQSSANITVNGTSSNGSGFFDPGVGFAQRISAAVTRGVVVNSVTYVNATTLTLNVNTVGASAGLANIMITNPDGQAVTGTNVLTIT